MEEDIKVIEEWLELDKKAFNNLFRESIVLPRKKEYCVLYSKRIKAMENLIKGYRELEKEYERVRAGRNWLSERISAQIATPEIFDKILEEKYIPKSKIKEKIEELKERPNKMVIDKGIPEEYKNLFLDEKAIQVLQEVMEDK